MILLLIGIWFGSGVLAIKIAKGVIPNKSLCLSPTRAEAVIIAVLGIVSLLIVTYHATGYSDWWGRRL